jgi:DNA-binding Lrp family transcriptional regulator
MPSLKPHDVVVALQLALTPDAPYRTLADSVGLSLGEIHNAIKRLTMARLLSADGRVPRKDALLDFLMKGVPYAFPAELGADTRGVPTAHAAPPLDANFSASDAVVWPFEKGERRGAAVEPLYEGAPLLPQRNRALYELLALVDAIRVGRARERELATKLLRERLASRA